MLCVFYWFHENRNFRVTHNEFREDTAPRTAMHWTPPFSCGKILSISNILPSLVAIVLTATEKIANKHPSQTENYGADWLANPAAWVLLFESKQYSACSTSHYSPSWSFLKEGELCESFRGNVPTVLAGRSTLRRYYSPSTSIQCLLYESCLVWGPALSPWSHYYSTSWGF